MYISTKKNQKTLFILSGKTKTFCDSELRKLAACAYCSDDAVLLGAGGSNTAGLLNKVVFECAKMISWPPIFQTNKSIEIT